MTTATEHTKDEDCTLDPETDVCRECGVWHAEPCLDCGGRGFHREDCPELAFIVSARNEWDAEIADYRQLVEQHRESPTLRAIAVELVLARRIVQVLEKETRGAWIMGAPLNLELALEDYAAFLSSGKQIILPTCWTKGGEG